MSRPSTSLRQAKEDVDARMRGHDVEKLRAAKSEAYFATIPSASTILPHLAISLRK
jgi:hypothetical protein